MVKYGIAAALAVALIVALVFAFAGGTNANDGEEGVWHIDLASLNLFRDTGMAWKEGSVGAPVSAGTFTSEAYGFSVAHPEGLSLTEYQESNGGHTFAFESADKKKGFQVFTIPYDEAQITASRIQKDTKSGPLDTPVEVVIAGERALLFYSKDPLAGKLREVWFLHNGRLYEVTAFDEHDAWLAGVMSTWKFIKSI